MCTASDYSVILAQSTGTSDRIPIAGSPYPYSCPSLNTLVIEFRLPPLRSRSAAMPRLPMLPTCGWFYDWEAMRRAEVLHVRGETAGKNPPLAPRSRPWVRRRRRSTRSSLAAGSGCSDGEVRGSMPPSATGSLLAPLSSPSLELIPGLVVLSVAPRRTGPALARRGGGPNPSPRLQAGG